MSKYNEDSGTRKRIDEINKTINEEIYPIINGTDCTVSEYKSGKRREKELKMEIKELDIEYWMSII